MPQMAVGANTTFTQVYNQFHTTGGSTDKHVRFENAQGLYTSKNASAATLADAFGGHRLQDRQQKQADGGARIRQAIRNEHPQLADRIFARLGQDHPGVDFTQGVTRGELAHIKAAVDAVVADHDHLRTLTPAGLAVTTYAWNPGRLFGDLEVPYNAAAADKTKTCIDQYLADVRNLPTAKLSADAGFPTVAKQFMLDVGRADLRVGGSQTTGTRLRAQGGEDPRVTLRRFAGSDEAALHLSKLLTQEIPTALVSRAGRFACAAANGDELVPRLPSGKLLPEHEKTQFISVARQGDRFVVDYAVASPLSGFDHGLSSITLDDNASSIKTSMQISISARDIQSGDLANYTVTKPPELSLHAEMTAASLAQQAANRNS